LENGWHHQTVDDEFSTVRDSVTDLRVEALYQYRVHRPVWETQLRGAPVALLGDTSPAGQTTDEDSPETLATKALLTDQVQNVLATLSEREAGVVRLLIMEGRTLTGGCGNLRYHFVSR
jgi:DNA-directed RNA polymerase specialized sigma24 family protein